ncbi:hypothetical protein [Sporosarcina sp. FSL K6-3457]|uniref:hypothetical protein n=1 Tax=Sporosarcina sp. FSL K6-3457 TaxID=2978204 RepID=UPI0030F9268D
MTENDKRRLSSIINVWNETKRIENMHPDYVRDVDWVMQEARNKHDIQQENEEITGFMVKMRDTFTDDDRRAEGHGMEDIVSCPTAVAQYALNKLERTIEDNKRLRVAIVLALNEHKWNNNVSAQILEQALEVLE